MTAIRHVLELIADRELVVSSAVVRGLGLALDDALERYAEVAGRQVDGGSR
ncbi:MAG: hypothetical protein KF782_12380 [Labilithrix sp.]|nr:hypothetical protein [Labilithrix sp.]